MSPPVFAPRPLEGLVDLLARGRGPVFLAEHLSDDEGEDVRRATEAVDAGAIDGQVERPAPALSPRLDFDHPVVGIDLVLGLLVHLEQAGEGRRRLVEAPERQAELGHVDGGDHVSRAGLPHPPRHVQGLGELSRAPVHLDEASHGADIGRISLGRLLKVADRVSRLPDREGRVAEIDERRDIVRAQLDGPLERRARLLERPLTGQRVAEREPGLGVARVERDGPLQVAGGVVEIELEARPSREPKQRWLVGMVGQAGQGGLPALAVVAGLEAGARLAGPGRSSDGAERG